MADIYEQIAEKIIEQQEDIIGPLAFDQARKVPGLRLDSAQHTVRLEGGDKKSLIEQLVKQYEALFGDASIEVCKDVVRKLQIPSDQLPALLR